MRKNVSLLILAVSLVMVGGCNTPKEQLLTFDRHFESSDYQAAAAFAEKNIKNKTNPAREDLLWTLQAAAAKRALKDYASSTSDFDKAEEFLKYYDLRFSAADDMAATAVNDNIIPYKGQEYDGVMVNVYKALNFLAEGNYDLAKVEFNRALDRQRRSKEHFEKEIAKTKESIDKAKYASLINDPNTQKTIQSQYPELNEYEPYRDYVNPFVTYLASIYFNATGDISTARNLLKETCGLVPENKRIADEFAETEAAIFTGRTIKNTVWVIFENGLGPRKDEFRIDLPLFIVTDRVQYVGIALPRLTYRDIAFPYLLIDANDAKYNTTVVGDMDRVIGAEFKKDFNGILARAIISTTGKALTQYAMTNQNSNEADIGSIMVAIYSFLTNAADVRIWTALPKDFQFARLQIPENKELMITPAGGQPIDIHLPNCDNVLVYIKITQRGSTPIYEVIPFGKRF
ncbi:MAG: hypothetical protein WC770_02025 [Phycisphaerae bacterium]|jgi:hypothetical protein